MSGCIAVAGTCGAPRIAGWKYCRKHLQVEYVAAENRELKRRIRLAREAYFAAGIIFTKPEAIDRFHALLDLRKPITGKRKSRRRP